MTATCGTPASWLRSAPGSPGRASVRRSGVVEAAAVQHSGQPVSGVAEQDLSVLQPLVVVGHGEVNLVRELLNLFEQLCGLFRRRQRTDGC